ncbi:MAG: hypothetical protein ABIH79_02915 [archaeon]
MKNTDGKLLIVGIILMLLISITGVYLYNFYVFKTVRFCVGEANNLEIICGTTPDCIDLIGGEIDSELNRTPNFIQEKFKEVIEEVIYCDKNCFVKNIRGINLETGEIEMLDSCEINEKEIIIEIRGKEGLEILEYLKSKNNV